MLMTFSPPPETTSTKTGDGIIDIPRVKISHRPPFPIVKFELKRGLSGSYPLPNDETEMARLDLVHHLQLLILRGQLCLTDLSDLIPTVHNDYPPNSSSDTPYRVLDLGTGTGSWALDFAEIHPCAHVTGTPPPHSILCGIRIEARS